MGRVVVCNNFPFHQIVTMFVLPTVHIGGLPSSMRGLQKISSCLPQVITFAAQGGLFRRTLPDAV